MLFKLLYYLIKQLPGRIGSRLRSLLYRDYFGGKPVQLGENVSIIGRHENFTAGDNFKVSPDVKLVARNASMRIGKNVFINYGSFLSADNGGLTIGDDCKLAMDIVIVCGKHEINRDHPVREQEYSGYPVVIGDDVWIGTKAVILGGISIGDGAVIGAGAVVSKNVAPYEIVGGVPARNIGYRK